MILYWFPCFWIVHRQYELERLKLINHLSSLKKGNHNWGSLDIWAYRGGSSEKLQGVCNPPPLRWSFLLRLYVFAFNFFLSHCQWCHSLEVCLLLRKILDPPLAYNPSNNLFSFACDWSTHVTWPNIPQLKLRNIQEYFPILKTACMVKKIWRIINTIGSIWENSIYAWIFVPGHYKFSNSSENCFASWNRCLQTNILIYNPSNIFIRVWLISKICICHTSE